MFGVEAWHDGTSFLVRTPGGATITHSDGGLHVTGLEGCSEVFVEQHTLASRVRDDGTLGPAPDVDSVVIVAVDESAEMVCTTTVTADGDVWIDTPDPRSNLLVHRTSMDSHGVMESTIIQHDGMEVGASSVTDDDGRVLVMVRDPDTGSWHGHCEGSQRRHLESLLEWFDAVLAPGHDTRS